MIIFFIVYYRILIWTSLDAAFKAANNELLWDVIELTGETLFQKKYYNCHHFEIYELIF